jgi:hypothetical protein
LTNVQITACTASSSGSNVRAAFTNRHTVSLRTLSVCPVTTLYAIYSALRSCPSCPITHRSCTRLVGTQAKGGVMYAEIDVNVAMTDVHITRCTASSTTSSAIVSVAKLQHSMCAHLALTYRPLCTQAYGGALYVWRIAALHLTSVTFDDNRAIAPNIAQGSAIYSTQVTSSLLTDCTFHNHDATASSMILTTSPLNWRCPLGTWAPLTGAIPRPGLSPDFTGCPEVCPLGTIGDRPNISNAADCPSCPKGHYCSEPGLAVPYPCPVGTRMPSEGARRANDCLPCGAGQFNNQTAQEECQPCPAGSFTAVDGSVSCTACPSGGWCPDAGGTSRLVQRECPAGSYNPDEGASTNASCRLCPFGTANPIPGQSSSSACVTCLPGSAAPATGTAVCTRCAAGTYQPDDGATACIGCTRGYLCVLGSSAPQPCPGGTHANQSTLTTVGFLSNLASDCLICPAGTSCSVGSDQPSACLPGFFGAAPRQLTTRLAKTVLKAICALRARARHGHVQVVRTPTRASSPPRAS